MKQTNNAIKFLLAQYRAIFKQAYLKGLVSAAVLTAGLAAGATANAANGNDVTADELANSGSIVVNNTNGNLRLQSATDTAWNAKVTIEEGAPILDDPANFIVNTGATGKVNITGQGSLTIKGKTDGVGLLVTPTVSQDINVDLGVISVERGTLSVATVNDSTTSGSINVAADVMNIGGSSNGATVSLSSTGSSKTLTFGCESGEETVGSAITITKGGLLSVDGTEAVNIVGASLDITNGGVMLTNKGDKNTVTTDNFTVDKNSFKIISGDGSATVTETFTGHKGEVSGNVLVGTSGNWVINASYDEGLDDFNDKDTSSAYEPGTDDIVGNVTFKSGANIQIGDSGAITVEQGTLTIEDGVNLNAIAGATTAPLISLNGQDKGTDETSTLEISSKTLKSFLTANDEYKQITAKSDNSGYELSKDTVKDGKGSVLLTSGSIMSLTDTAQVDLSKTFTFSSGATAVAGDIVVNTNSTIYGKDIAVSDLLKSGTGSPVSALKLNVEADTLTLGSDKFDTSSQTSGSFNVAAFEAHDSINFQSKGNTFYLKNTVELDRADDGSVGKIAGDNLQIGSGTSGGFLNVTGGTFETNGQNITLVSGSSSGKVALQVTSDSGDDTTTAENGITYYTNPVDSYLTINGGKFILSGSAAADAVVEVKGVKGADATLDLTKTSVKWGKGTINITGDDDNGYIDSEGNTAGKGIVKITGSQLSSFLQSTDTLLGIGNDGILDINGAVTGDITFDKLVDENPGTGSGKAQTAGVVSFTGGGILQTNGELSLVAKNLNDTLNIGAGIISAQAITISDKNIDTEDKGTDDDFVKIDNGTLQVQKRISSANKTIIFGDGTEGADLKLSAASVSDTGTVANDLKFNNRSAFNVEQGNWLMKDKDITLDGARLLVQTTIDDNGEYTGASLTADNLAVTANNTGNAGGQYEIGVNKFASATFNTLQTLEDSRALVYGTLTILGRGDIDTSAESTELDSVQDAAETAGVDLTGTAITVSGSNAKLEFGNTATSKLVTVSSTKDDTDGYIKIADELGDVTLQSGAQLRLNFTSDAVFTAEMAKELKEEAVAELNNGFINIGSGSLSIKYDVDNETAPETSWDNVKDFVQIESEVTNDKLLKTLITDIDAGDVVSGHYGALQTNFDGNTSVQVDGKLTLHTARDGYFVFYE